VLHTRFDYAVSNESIDENIVIIDDYAGGLFEAHNMYLHVVEIGGIVRVDKHMFQAQLAFVSLFNRFCGIIREMIDTEIAVDAENELDDDENENDDDALSQADTVVNEE
jgi:hypothetical protein